MALFGSYDALQRTSATITLSGQHTVLNWLLESLPGDGFAEDFWSGLHLWLMIYHFKWGTTVLPTAVIVYCSASSKHFNSNSPLKEYF
jgi:hypothetical protein